MAAAPALGRPFSGCLAPDIGVSGRVSPSFHSWVLVEGNRGWEGDGDARQPLARAGVKRSFRESRVRLPMIGLGVACCHRVGSGRCVQSSCRGRTAATGASGRRILVRPGTARCRLSWRSSSLKRQASAVRSWAGGDFPRPSCRSRRPAHGGPRNLDLVQPCRPRSWTDREELIEEGWVRCRLPKRGIESDHHCRRR